MSALGEVSTAAGTLLIAASFLAAFSGVPLPSGILSGQTGQRFASLLLVVADIAGAGSAAAILLSGRSITFSIPWSLPFGPCEFGIDPLSALFSLPVFIVSACGSLYSLQYWPAARNPRNIRKITFFFGLLTSAMTWVVLARNGVLFLIAWEIMALAAYFLLTTQDEKTEVREAGILYMITTHTGTLALFALFALLRAAAGDFVFPGSGSVSADGAAATWIFAVALFGFGMKAGLMPLHVWLPSAHANAPSHVSAFMSGVILKMGIYGLVRTFSFFSGIPLWWGTLVLMFGVASGIAGVAFAIGQHDLKRLLAYHSIENIGIITMGIGIALIGRAVGNPALAFFGMAGALLHVVNHATFKSLLFLAAGSVIHAAGTREIDEMGGAARRLPWTSGFFLVGAIAICGLPPLNGFVSEFLIYLGLFTAATEGSGAGAAFPALAAPALALIGGLAVACFVKVFGVVFLGSPRSPGAGDEAGRWMLAPMAVLAAICAAIGLAPQSVAGILAAAVSASYPDAATPGTAFAPFAWIAAVNMTLAFLIAAMALLFAGRSRKLPNAAAETWGCGYLRPEPRMQYTGSSFGEMLVTLFRGILQPLRHEPVVKGLSPRKTRFASHVPETALENFYLPLLEKINVRLGVIRRLQRGQIHLYILYIFVTLIALIVWAM